VQPDEWVRVEPVAARAMPPIDEDDARIGLGDESVDKRHAGRPGTDHEIVGLEGSHRALLIELVAPAVILPYPSETRTGVTPRADNKAAGCDRMGA
jgi:hypothetical protein